MLMLVSPDNRQLWLLLTVLVAWLLTGVLRAQEMPVGFFDYLGAMVEQDGELLDPLVFGSSQDPQQDPRNDRKDSAGAADGSQSQQPVAAEPDSAAGRAGPVDVEVVQ